MYSVVFMRSLDDDGFYFGSRINCLAAVCLLQAWMMWNFINFHLRRMRERGAASRKLRSPKKTKSKGKAKVMRIQNIHVNVWNQDFYFTYRIFLLLFFFFEKLNLRILTSSTTLILLCVRYTWKSLLHALNIATILAS